MSTDSRLDYAYQLQGTPTRAGFQLYFFYGDAVFGQLTLIHVSVDCKTFCHCNNFTHLQRRLPFEFVVVRHEIILAEG